MSERRVLTVATPPAPTAPGQSWVLGVLPALGVLPLVLLGVGHGSALLVAGLAVPVLVGTLGAVVGQRRRSRRERRAAVGRWWSHLDDLVAQADGAAVRQRLALDHRHPADLLAVARARPFERPDLVVAVGTGDVPAAVLLELAPLPPLEPTDAPLVAAAREAVDASAALAAAPVTVDLAAVGTLRVVGSGRSASLRRIAAELAVSAPSTWGLTGTGGFDRDGSPGVRVDASQGLVVAGDGPGAVLDTDREALVVGDVVTHLDSIEVLETPGAQAISSVLRPLLPVAHVPSWAELSRVETGRLGVPVGVGPDGPVVLDLAEAAHGGDGPHGLLVGATGSGKSVLLRTVVTGLAARRSPDEVRFLLVDFKGGAAFAQLAALPHVSGVVTNLADDAASLARVAAALDAEVDRRQRALRDAGVADALGVLPSLVVVVDEAGELLAAAPEVADVLARIGRVGRSLGIHLLLSTQTWDGARTRALDPHLRYRFCLRTVGADDSRAVLGSDVARDLPARPGAAWLAVDGVLRRVDVAAPPADPLSVASTGSPAPPVWLPPLPASLAWQDGAIGLVDRPDLQAYQALSVPDDAHVAVVGGPRSGVSTALRSIVLASGAARADVVDLTGGLVDLGRLPCVATVACRDDPELVAAVVAAAAEGRDRLLVVDGVAALRSADGAVEEAMAEIAASGLGRGVRLVVGARRWSDLRGGLFEACATRVELRLGDPSESLVGRARAVPADAPAGRGVTASGHALQVADPSTAPAPLQVPRPAPVRTLPSRVVEPAAAGDGAFLLGVAGPALAPVTLDLLAPGRHLVVAGDAGSGRSTVLRRVVEHLGRSVHLVDPRRTHAVLVSGTSALGNGTSARGEAASAAGSTGPSGGGSAVASWSHDPAVLADVVAELSTRRENPCATGDPVVVVVDDLDLVDTAPTLAALADLLPFAAEIGLHLVVARSASGRSFDPLSQRLRPTVPWLVQLPGEHADGPAAGRAAPDRVGRAVLSRGAGTARRVQCFDVCSDVAGPPGRRDDPVPL